MGNWPQVGISLRPGAILVGCCLMGKLGCGACGVGGGRYAKNSKIGPHCGPVPCGCFSSWNRSGFFGLGRRRQAWVGVELAH